MQAGYVPAEVAPELCGRRAGGRRSGSSAARTGRRIGLRVLLAPADAWIQEPAAAERAGLLARLEPVATIDPGDTVAFACRTPAGARDRGAVEPSDPDGRRSRADRAGRGARRARRTDARRPDRARCGRASWGDDWADGETLRRGPRGRPTVATAAPARRLRSRPVPRRDGHAAAGAGRALDHRRRARWGGNIDCTELVAGTTLYLPIPVDGALLLGRRRPRARRATARSRGPRSSARSSAPS